MSDSLREALAELVACKDLKIEIARFVGIHTIVENRAHNARVVDYQRRQPLAWEAARRALADTQPKLSEMAFEQALPSHQAQAVASSPEAAGAPLSGFTTIPVGTLLMHDHSFGRWPDCANVDAADPATVFEVKELRNGGTIELTAPGFGGRGDYRNGSILVKRGHWLEAWRTQSAASGLSADARSNDPTTGGLKERPEPALTDEREAFEEWWGDSVDALFPGSKAMYLWQGWQARAALSPSQYRGQQ